ncbi:pleiotropic drug resistance protein 3-like [Gossypium australe]|uniref:Pleiotropic drug resistance protein 3-like n=1 Tax=Gossypium australe TaxID=47621 RepID=A0A5B6X3Q6_9ROSI|nr:pleiotropic drug resistance protein 3-like [Gossypium australe]
MTSNAAIFKNIDRKFKTRVKVGNGHFIKAEGKGDVLIDTPTGIKLISNVLFVPKIDRNLLSIAQLLEKGYLVVFRDKECLVSDPSGSKLMLVTMADRSSVVDWNKSLDNAYTTILDQFKLWHKRLGHANYKSLVQLTKRDLVEKFQGFCDEACIKHQLTNTYTPQQNGVSERKNQTLLDMARCLMFERNLPKNFWAEAVNTTVYLQNRLPTKALVQKTPFEAWFGFKPSLAHLRVFGFICYAHVPVVKRDKMAKMAQPGILVGYNCVKKGYFGSYIQQGFGDQDDPEIDIDNEPVKGTRPLAEVYARAYVATVEPTFARLVNMKVIGVQWVFRAKHNADGTLNKLKARLVVKGFSQKYGIDYFETFAPRLKGFKVIGKEDSVYKQKKALYSLKQAPRAWYDRINIYLTSLGFGRSISEPNLYVKKEGVETQLIVSLYMDDLLVTGGNKIMLVDFKRKIERMFGMSDLGQISYFLCMEVSQTQQGNFLSQKAFFLKILNKFSMLNCKATSTPVVVGEKLTSQGDFERVAESTYRSLVGCLLYLTATRPDVMSTVKLLSRFMHCCNASHFQVAKKVLRYIKGTLSFGMMYTKVDNLKLLGYLDSDWARSIDDMKSTSGYLFTLGSTIFCWSLKKKNVVS